MHKYDHHIGDYDRDTGHLTLLEHGIYRRLLDRMYADERPLPKDLEQIFRRISARTKNEKDAVKNVLSEFFILDEGYRHKRVEEEIQLNENRIVAAKYATVVRFYKSKGFGNPPSREEFGENPDWYIHPDTGVIGNYRASNADAMRPHTNRNAEQMQSDAECNAYLPPSTFHLPPNTPIVPKGTADRSLLLRVKRLFTPNAKPDFRLDVSLDRAWKKNKGAVEETTEADWSLLEEAYAQTEGDAAKFRRKDPAQLLNNWSAELTRAATWKRDAGSAWRGKRTVAAKDGPDGWRDVLLHLYPSASVDLAWADLSADMRVEIAEILEKKEGGAK